VHIHDRQTSAGHGGTSAGPDALVEPEQAGRVTPVLERHKARVLEWPKTDHVGVGFRHRLSHQTSEIHPSQQHPGSSTRPTLPQAA